MRRSIFTCAPVNHTEEIWSVATAAVCHYHSAQSASPSGENLGGWRNAIHFRINSTMQKLIGFSTVGSVQATHIKHLFLTFALAVVRTVLGIIDSGAAVHVSQADPENPQPVAPAPAGAPSGTLVSVPRAKFGARVDQCGARSMYS